METLRPTRRTLTRTAAWTVPVVAVATAAPAFAASPCNCPEFYYPGFPASGGEGTTGNGWTLSATGGTSGGGSDVFQNGSFVTVADPPRSGTRVAKANRSICVTSGAKYTFSYTYTAYLSNPRPQTSELQVNGVTIGGSTINTNSSGSSGSRSVTWTANTTGNVDLAFVHTCVANGNTVTGNDITISNFSCSCASA